MQDWINIRKIEYYKSQNQQNKEEKYDHPNRFRKKNGQNSKSIHDNNS